MTTFYLIRHGSNDSLAHKLVGRQQGIHLNDAGRREAEQIAATLARQAISRILSSPLERCRETAEASARKLGLEVWISEALNEVQFGDWTGRTFAELDEMESWKQWNTFRSGTRPPNGESMLEVQARVVTLLQDLHRHLADSRLAIISHGDPLRSALIYFLGAPGEFIRRIELGPGSISVLVITDWDAQIRCLNVRPGIEAL